MVAPEDQKVSQNGIANFYCAATGSPVPEMEWHKSGQRIGRHHKRYLTVEAGDGALVLRIEPVRARRDQDTYECHADNRVGSAAVAHARLHVYADAQSGQNQSVSLLLLWPYTRCSMGLTTEKSLEKTNFDMMLEFVNG